MERVTKGQQQKDRQARIISTDKGVRTHSRSSVSKAIAEVEPSQTAATPSRLSSFALQQIT